MDVTAPQRGEAATLMTLLSVAAAAVIAGGVAGAIYFTMAGAACRIVAPSAAEIRFNPGRGCERLAPGGVWVSARGEGRA